MLNKLSAWDRKYDTRPAYPGPGHYVTKNIGRFKVPEKVSYHENYIDAISERNRLNEEEE